MSRLFNIGKSVLLSGGIISNGSLGGYISDAARRGLGMGLAEFQDGAVHYFSKDKEILKRALTKRPRSWHTAHCARIPDSCNTGNKRNVTSICKANPRRVLQIRPGNTTS